MANLVKIIPTMSEQLSLQTQELIFLKGKFDQVENQLEEVITTSKTHTA